jgi:hypothetical protein
VDDIVIEWTTIKSFSNIMTGTAGVAQLSSQGLANLVVKESDFVFAVNGEEITCSRFQAQFVSPKVSDLLKSDPTMDRFELNVSNGSTVGVLLSGLVERGEFDLSAVSVVGDLGRALGNTEMLAICLRSTSSAADESNVLQRLNLFPIEEDISFLASHFASVSSQSEIQSLDADLLSRVLRDRALSLESEDSLFRLIERLCGENESYLVLLDFVEAQYLSDSCIQDYITFVDSDQLSAGVWMSICRRLSLHVTPSKANPRTKSLSFPVPRDGSPRFVGIFHHLCEECKGNPHLAGKIEVSANDERTDRTFQVYDLITDASKTAKWWGTGNSSVDHYVKIDFRDAVVRPSGYALKAHNSSWAASFYIRS